MGSRCENEEQSFNCYLVAHMQWDIILQPLSVMLYEYVHICIIPAHRGGGGGGGGDSKLPPHTTQILYGVWHQY